MQFCECTNNNINNYKQSEPFGEVNGITVSVNIIELVDSISRDERDSPLTQYITNAGISRVRYTITHLNTTIVFYC